MYRSSSSETALALPAAVEKGDKSPVPPPQETYHQKQGAANQVVLVNDDEDMGAAPTTDDFDPVPVATTAGGDEQTMVDRDSPPHIVSQCNSHDDGAFMMTNVDTAAEDVTAMSRRCVQFLDLEAGLERKRLSSSQEGGMDEHSQLGETESQSNVQNATTTVNDNSSKVVPVDSDDDGDIPITIEKAVQNSMASSSSSSKSSSRPAAMMSPITMCFERMLGAGMYQTNYCTELTVLCGKSIVDVFFCWCVRNGYIFISNSLFLWNVPF